MGTDTVMAIAINWFEMLSRLTLKRNIQYTGLLDGWTDVHSHLLFGVDDGIQNLTEAKAALEFLWQKGVKRMYLTPHVMDEYPANTPENLSERFQILSVFAPSELELNLAAEYMLDSGFEQRMKGGLLTLDGAHVLVETSYLSAPSDFRDLLYNLVLEKYIPVLAHPERYMYMTIQTYRSLKENGVKFQLNLFSLTGMYGIRSRQNAEYLLRQGFYDFVGSDLHHINMYSDNIKRLYLNGHQISRIRQLMANNDLLWDTVNNVFDK